MTVNGLLAELRKLQREGRGNQTVYIHRKGDVLCLPSDGVTKHWDTRIGHVVIGTIEPPRDHE